jgi:hypothetical protein
MTRIYVSENGSDKNDGLTRERAIYSWKRARKLFDGHLEISVDSASARKRLIAEMKKPKKNYERMSYSLGGGETWTTRKKIKMPLIQA